MKVAVIGAGWSGLSTAIFASQAGHAVTVFEASRMLGGRARSLPAELPNGQTVELDNGQHILIGAYREALALMRMLGIPAETALTRQALTLRFADGHGLRLPKLPKPLDLLAGIALARGWSWGDRIALLRTALAWKRKHFSCPDQLSVSELARPLGERLMRDLIEPLCVSALNTPADQASAQVFLRVLHDALFGLPGGSDLLLPRVPLGRLLPEAAANWLQSQGTALHLGRRIDQLTRLGEQWHIEGQAFDALVLATPARDSCRLLEQVTGELPAALCEDLQSWRELTGKLRFEAITTVYAWSPQAALPCPMLAMSSTLLAPAQFVFDRGQLGGPAGLLAFVISASRGERTDLQGQVLQQAVDQLSLKLAPVLSVTEKQATFACQPGLKRPPTQIAPGLFASGDFVEGPYPATLEGAVRNAQAAVEALQTSPQASH